MQETHDDGDTPTLDLMLDHVNVLRQAVKNVAHGSGVDGGYNAQSLTEQVALLNMWVVQNASFLFIDDLRAQESRCAARPDTIGERS